MVRRSFRYSLVLAGLAAAVVGFVPFADAAMTSARALGNALHLSLAARDAVSTIAELWILTVVAGLLGAGIAAPVGMLIRVAARRHMRGGGRDQLAWIRGKVDEHRALPSLVAAMPSVLVGMMLWLMAATSRSPDDASSPALRLILPLFATPALWGLAALSRRYLALLLRPPMSAEDRVRSAPSPDEIHFAAVAVTRESKALVAAFGLLTAAFLAVLTSLPYRLPMEHALGGTLAYALFGAAMVGAYRRASRIVVGADGVLIKGTSRTRFFAYRDLDDVTSRAFGSVVLRARGRDVLALELHGDDARLYADIGARIGAHIARAHEEAGHGLQRFAEAASSGALARAAHGQGDYRARGTSRDDLMALIESPATAPAARVAAAEALAQASDGAELRRIRVAAERCADPAAREALRKVAAASREAAAEEEALAAEAQATERARRG